MLKPRTLISIGATVLLAAATVLLPASPASAGVLDLTCTPPSSNLSTYTPPLTSTPQDVTITSSILYGPCVSASVPGLTSGVSGGSGPLSGRSCLDLQNATPIVFGILWNTGETSVIAGNATSTTVGAVLVRTLTGTVVSGLFAGDTVLEIATAPATPILLCTLGLGSVSSIHATVVLEIASV